MPIEMTKHSECHLEGDCVTCSKFDVVCRMVEAIRNFPVKVINIFFQCDYFIEEK